MKDPPTAATVTMKDVPFRCRGNRQAYVSLPSRLHRVIQIIRILARQPCLHFHIVRLFRLHPFRSHYRPAAHRQLAHMLDSTQKRLHSTLNQTTINMKTHKRMKVDYDFSTEAAYRMEHRPKEIDNTATYTNGDRALINTVRGSMSLFW
jgi:hypothetical protein